MTHSTKNDFANLRAVPFMALFVFFVFAAMGCTSEMEPGASAPGGCGDLTGAWGGTWVSRTSSGTWNVELSQSEAGDLDGDIALTGTVCGSGGPVTGRVDPDSCELSFGLVDTSRCDVSYFGRVAGDSMEGSMEAVAVSYGGLRDDGTWEGSRR